MNVTTRPALLDIARIREDFPILGQRIRGKPLVFLDSAASAQKPRVVIDAMREAMETQYANVHSGLHWMSERTTDAYEAARDAVTALLNARDRHEVVFRTWRNAARLISYVPKPWLRKKRPKFTGIGWGGWFCRDWL